jgi:hypothetical protein
MGVLLEAAEIGLILWLWWRLRAVESWSRGPAQLHSIATGNQTVRPFTKAGRGG